MESSTVDSSGMNMTNSSGNSNENENTSTDSLSNEISFGIGVFLVVAGLGSILFLVYWQTRFKRRNKNYLEVGKILKQSEDIAMDNQRRDSISHYNEPCEKDIFKNEIFKGQLMRTEVRKKGKEKHGVKKEDTMEFLIAYDKVSENFVETQMMKICNTKLERIGLVILIGKQGCGKTLTAVNIMKSNNYEGWIKRKFTSWSELLCFDPKAKTVFFIDNILEGYMHSHDIQNWWNSLVYFYFTYIWKQSNIRLLITAKEHVMENVCQYIEKNIPLLEKTIFLRAESIPLTYDDRLKILEMQVGFAEETCNIQKPMVIQTLHSLKNTRMDTIGFPLSAHLYAFEERENVKGPWIFENPKYYVRNQIAYEIRKDETEAVKTLFLILLLNDTSAGSKYTIDLKNKQDCVTFVERECSKELVDNLRPLHFESLAEKAKELENKMLIKQSTMYEFQNQIYLEGVCDYFFGENFDAVVVHFPLDILRTYEFQDISIKDSEKLMERLKVELFKNAISETLSCKILKESSIENMLCEKLKQEPALKELLMISDKASTFDFPIIFWANKYRLKKLSKMLWDFVEKYNLNEDLQFYLARLGQCCEKDESYITRLPHTWDTSIIINSVCNFRSSDKKTILHILVSSEMSDYDAHRFLCKILHDAPEHSISVDSDLLVMALEHTKCSRLLCILELLNRRNDKLSTTKKEVHVISCLNQMKESFWKLEWVVRICMVLAYNENQNIDFKVKTKEHHHITYLLDGNAKTQSQLARFILVYIKRCQNSSLSSTCNDRDVFKHIKNEITLELKKAFLKSIQIQLGGLDGSEKEELSIEI